MDPISENPYAAPQTFDAPPVSSDSAELIRREHLKVETSIKSIGILYYLAGIFVIRLGISFLSQYEPGGISGLAEPAIGVLLLILAVFQFVAGAAIRKLKPWSRIAVGILSGFGLLGFPVGTLINAYILYLVFSKKGKTVFSESYKEIIAATPHIKYKTPKVIWIVLAVAAAVIALLFASVILS